MKNTLIIFLGLLFTPQIHSQTTAPPAEFIFSTSHEEYCSDSPFQQEWEFVGPTDNHKGIVPYQGIITCVARDAGNSDIIYAGGNTQGLFKTTDGGTTWFSITDQLKAPGLGINQIVMHPQNSNVLYACTGQRSNKYGGYSLGVIKTLNGGSTWEIMSDLGLPLNFDNNFYDYVLRTISLHPLNPDRVFVGGRKAIYHSDNGGNSWDSVSLPGQADFYVIDFEFNPANSQIIYASTISNTSNDVNVWVSTNGGESWQIISPTVFSQKAMRLDMTPADPNHLYCAFINSGGTLDVMKSGDHGLTWMTVASGLAVSGFDFYKCEFEISNLSPNLIYYGDVNFRVARYNGSQWLSGVQHTGMHDDIRDIKLYPASAGSEYLLVGSDGGVQFATCNANDVIGGATISWGELNGEGLSITQIYGLGVWNRNPNAIFGGQDIGTWRINGDSYSHVYPGDGAFTSVNEYFNTFGAGGNQSGKSYTKDSGSSFDGVPSDFDSPEGESYKTLTLAHSFSGKDQRQLYVAGDDLAKWTIQENNLTLSGVQQVSAFQIPSGTANDPMPATAFAVAPSDGLTMYIAFAGTYWVNNVADIVDPNLVNAEDQLINRFFKSTDGGITWDDITDELYYINGNNQKIYPYQWFSVSCIEVDPRNAQRVYIGISSYTSAPNQTRVMVSDNGGQSWEDISMGLGSYPIRQLRYQDGSDEVIYAATDAGVFRWNADSQEWSCFNNGLPPCIVTTMNFDYCENSMTIGTYGRGIWKIALPAIDNDVTFSSNYTVEKFEVHSYPNSIVIDNGATLTVKGHLYFKSGKGIVVKPGSKLIVDGGRLSNACGNQFWKGIQVVGNPSAAQNSSVQGVVELKNGAIIEHAEIGVLAGVPPQTAGKKSYLKGGGIVKCIGSEFRNNVVDIRFAPYLFAPSASYVFDSQLITDEVYSEERLPESHIIMERIKGVKIRGNWFNNEVYEQYAPQTRGIGISSNTATYEVIPYCTYNINGVCQSSVENRFSNLYQGIQAYSTSLAFPFAVQDAFFENNVGGIAMTGVYGASVTRCEFEVPGDVELPNPDASAFGIYLFGCAGFEIEENNLVRSPNGAQLTSGIAVRESIGSNRIYKNTMDGFTVGTNVMGKNTGIDFSEGLQVLCNNFGQESMMNTFDIALTDFEMDYTDNEPTMAATQGMMPESQLDVASPAGNLFSYNPASTAFDYYAEPDANSVIYFSHSPSSTYNVIPQSIEGELIVVVPSGTVNYHPQNSCPSDISIPVVIPNLISKMAMLDGLLEDEWMVYREQVDMGSTADLISFIKNPNHTSIQVRNALMLFPKNVSNEAWHAAIHRIPAMNPWHLAQALIAGSPLRPEVIRMMDQAGINSYYINLVKNNQPGGVTSKMILESEMTHFNGNRQHALNGLMRAYFSGDSSVSTVHAVTHLEKGDSWLKVPLHADLLISIGELDNAEAILGSCIEDGEPDDWCLFQKQLVQAMRDSLSWDSLPASFLDHCYFLSAHPQKRGSAQAQALLSAMADSLFEQEIAYPQSVKVIRTDSPRSDKSHRMEVYPNPARSEINVVFSREMGELIDRIEIVDANGKIVLAHGQLPNAIWIADVSGLSSGQYVVNALSGNRTIQSTKFQIIR